MSDQLFNNQTPAQKPDPLFQPLQTSQEVVDAGRAVERKAADYSWSQFAQDIANYDWRTTQLFAGETAPAPDVNWEPSSAEILAFKEQVPEYLHERLYDARSAEHLKWLIPKLQEEDQANDRFASLSTSGQYGRMAISMLDPVELAVSAGAEAATLGLATPLVVAKYGAKAKMATRLLGGASNAAVGVGLNAAHGEDDPYDYALGMAFDFGLGAALAPGLRGTAVKQMKDIKSGNVGTPEVEASMVQQYNALQDSYDAKVSGSSAGAAASPNVDDAVQPAMSPNTPELSQADVPVGPFAGARFSVTGKAVTSPSPVERAIAPYLGEDAVGNPGTKTAISATEWAAQNHQRVEAKWKQAVNPAWNEWAKSNGIGLWGRKMASEKNFDKFSSQVVDYMEDTRPGADTLYPKEIVQAGQKAREVFADFLEDLKNPGRQDGLTLRALEGAEDVDVNPHYVPKVADREAIDRMIATHGYDSVKLLVKQAIERGLAAEQKVIDNDLLDRVAEGYTKNLSSAAYGMGDDLGEALSGRSASKLTASLKAAGIDDETVIKIRDALKPSDASTSRLKGRTPIDYNHTVELSTGKLSMRDLFSRDIDHILMSYSRRMSGEVALGRIRIKDPSQPDSPNYWIDGITSRAEYETRVLDAIRDDHARRKLGKEKTDLAIKRAEFLYRAALGLPQHDLSPTMTRAMRRIRDYNFLRLMNNMGVTQVIETGRVFSMTGLRAALSQMPSLKRIIEEGSGDYVLNNKMARELEMWGVTDNDYWIGASKYRYQEELIGETPVSEPGRMAKLGQGFDTLANRGKEVLANTSLMRPVHSRMQQWAARSAVQWFADLADNPELAKKYMARIMDMDLDAKDLDNISKEVRKWADARDSDRRKITAMNFDKWDPQVRSKFLYAVRRYTNRIVQKNDPGNLPMFMEHPVAKTFMQFRTFTFASYEKATLWNLRHKDTMAVAIAVGDVSFGAATYALMAHARAASREDKDEYLDKELELGNLASMGFARAGIASVAPMFIDTALAFTPADPLFANARASGTATTALGGSAAIDLFNGIGGAAKAMTSSLYDDRELSQQELQGMFRNLPFGNHVGSINLLNSMITDRDLMAPRKERE